MHPSQLIRTPGFAISKAHTQQKIGMPENLSSFYLFPQQNDDNEFKEKAIEQLHLRSLYLVNTKQYAEINDKISSQREDFSLNFIMKTFDMSSNENRKESKSKSGKKEDDVEVAILTFLKEDQCAEIAKNEDEKCDKNTNISLEKDSHENLSNDKEPFKENTTLTRSTSVYTNVTEIRNNASENYLDCFPNPSLNNDCDFEQSLRKELEKVVHFILNNMGKRR